MAANDELPRGWQQQSGLSSGANAQLVFPAIPGVAWVLTNIQASGNSGYTGAYTLTLEVNSVIYAITSGNAAASADAEAEVGWNGQIAFLPDTAVTVLASQTGSLNVSLLAEAYPV